MLWMKIAIETEKVVGGSGCCRRQWMLWEAVDAVDEDSY